MRISDWSSDVCSSDLQPSFPEQRHHQRLVGIVNAAVTRIVVDETVTIAHAHRRIMLPVLANEFDRVVAAGSEADHAVRRDHRQRSEEHTSELQSLMRISYAVF